VTIDPFLSTDTIEQRKAKIVKINAITEDFAELLLQPNVSLAVQISRDLDAAGILLNDDNPTIWQAQVVEVIE
jgi:hypothetical protein